MGHQAGRRRRRRGHADRAGLADRVRSGSALIPRLVVQPWLEGSSISLSMLCVDGENLLLSRNRQRLRISDGRVSLAGLEVNAEIEDLFQPWPRSPAGSPRRFPDSGATSVWIWSLTDHGPVVLEVNPRLTTSYCGIGASARDQRGRHGARPAGARSPSPLAEPRRPGQRWNSIWRPVLQDDAVIGWDLGGAHLKAARLDGSGRVLEVVQVACRLWEGMHHFHSAVDDVGRALGDVPLSRRDHDRRNGRLLPQPWRRRRPPGGRDHRAAARLDRPLLCGRAGVSRCVRCAARSGRGGVGELDGDRRARGRAAVARAPGRRRQHHDRPHPGDGRTGSSQRARTMRAA